MFFSFLGLSTQEGLPWFVAALWVLSMIAVAVLFYVNGRRLHRHYRRIIKRLCPASSKLWKYGELVSMVAYTLSEGRLSKFTVTLDVRPEDHKAVLFEVVVSVGRPDQPKLVQTYYLAVSEHWKIENNTPWMLLDRSSVRLLFKASPEDNMFDFCHRLQEVSKYESANEYMIAILNRTMRVLAEKQDIELDHSLRLALSRFLTHEIRYIGADFLEYAFREQAPANKAQI